MTLYTLPWKKVPSHWATADGSAIAGLDHDEHASSMVTIPVGATTAPDIDVVILGDSEVELDEHFHLQSVPGTPQERHA